MEIDPGTALLQLGPWRLVGVAALTVLGSIMAGLSGLGGGMLLAMAIAPVVGVKALVPIVAVAMLVNHIFRVWVFRHSVDWSTATFMTCIAVPTTVLGAVVYVALSAKTIAVMIGTFVFLFVVARRLIGGQAWRLNKIALGGVAIVFGFLSGSTIGAGMVVVPALLGFGLTGAALVGTDAVLGLAVIIAKTLTFGGLDILTTDVVVFGLVMGAASSPGIYVARWILERTSVRVHVGIVELMIVLGAGSIVYRGLTE